MDFRSLRQPQPNTFAQMMQLGEQTPQQMQQSDTPFSEQQLLEAAQSQGFDSYEQMIEYRRLRLPPPRRPRRQVQPVQEHNVLQQFRDDPRGTTSSAFDWHPARTIDNASKKLEEANRRNRRNR